MIKRTYNHLALDSNPACQRKKRRRRRRRMLKEVEKEGRWIHLFNRSLIVSVVLRYAFFFILKPLNYSRIALKIDMRMCVNKK